MALIKFLYDVIEFTYPSDTSTTFFGFLNFKGEDIHIRMATSNGIIRVSNDL